jgi:hypothetical protein
LNLQNIEFLLQKKNYDGEILYGSSWSNCGRKIDKINKEKYKGKKSHAEDWTQILTKLPTKSGVKQQLVQNGMLKIRL